MTNPYERLSQLVCDLMEIGNWAENLLEIKEGEVAYVLDYECDGEQCQASYPLNDGTSYYAEIQPEVIESYKWDHADRLIEDGEPPLTVALVVAAGVSSLVMVEVIRAVDALPPDCIWRDSVRRDLRLRFVEVYPFSDSFVLDASARIKFAREFLETIIAIEKEFGLKLSSLAMLEEELTLGYAPSSGNSRFALQSNDYGLLRAMKDLGAERCVKTAAEIMQKAERTGYGKHAFTRLLANGLAKSTHKGYLLTPLGLATANGS